MKKYLLLAPLFFGLSATAKASSFFDRIRTIGEKAYGQSIPPSPLEVIEAIVVILLGFVGTIFVVLIIYSGVKWMSSLGNEKKITEAKDTVRSATIGLIIVVLSYAISATVMTWLEGAV